MVPLLQHCKINKLTFRYTTEKPGVVYWVDLVNPIDHQLQVASRHLQMHHILCIPSPNQQTSAKLILPLNHHHHRVPCHICAYSRNVNCHQLSPKIIKPFCHNALSLSSVYIAQSNTALSRKFNSHLNVCIYISILVYAKRHTHRTSVTTHISNSAAPNTHHTTNITHPANQTPL